jgi:predicted GIY-YIG superfamily endonuclease
MSKGKNVIFQDGEWWYVGCSDGGRRRLSSHRRKNKKRMFINGNYVNVNHPLHKPGRYENFEDAAFDSLKNYAKSKEGQVYIISNPNFKGWVKVGMAVDANDRLNNYQTSSPFRDYKLDYTFDTEDRRASEAAAHTALDARFPRNGEWFKCSPRQAWSIIANVVNQSNKKAA